MTALGKDIRFLMQPLVVEIGCLMGIAQKFQLPIIVGFV